MLAEATNQSATIAQVHVHVGDDVVTWPLTAYPTRNARCVLCFVSIERTMAYLAAEYRDFEIAPAFHRRLHAGPSHCQRIRHMTERA